MNAYGVTVEVYNLDDGSAVRMRPYVQYLFAIIALGVFALLWSQLAICIRPSTNAALDTTHRSVWAVVTLVDHRRCVRRLGFGGHVVRIQLRVFALVRHLSCDVLDQRIYLGSGTTRIAIRSLPLLITYTTFAFIHALQTDTAQVTPVLLLPLSFA